MQKTGYSIKLWHKEGSKYEDLGVIVEAIDRKNAISVFRKETNWIEKEGTSLVAIPPICR